MTRQSPWRLASALSLLLLIVACDVYRDDDEDEGGPVRPPPVQSPFDQTAALPPAGLRGTATAGGGVITVRPGQTLYGVSRQEGVPLRALIDANNLAPPFLLRAGQTLVIPRVRTYTTQPGDTLYTITHKTGVEAATLTRLNHLEPPYAVAAGTVLVLPGGAAGTPDTIPASLQSGPTSRPTGPGSAGIVTQALPPPTSSGQAASRIAPPPAAVEPVPIPEAPPDRPLSVEAPTPAKPMPQPSAPATVAAATVTPPVAKPLPAANPPSTVLAPVPVTNPAPPAAVSPPPPPAAAKPAPPPEPESGVTSAPAAAPGPEVAAIVAHHHPPTAPLFYWPLRGKVLSTYGEAAGGTHNDGINIAAPEGTEIDAAEGGVVAYADNELRGFGNLLLIKHADGWVTAYAHAKELLVKKGDHVRRGQAIAKVGSTGGVDRPQLHFELRQGTRAIDPLDHLPPPASDGN